MKGVFADSQQLFGRHLLSAMLPSHTYGNCSGGIPKNIPDLTWNDLKEFHAKHYSPQNAKFFTYGNLPLEDHLEALDDYMKNASSKSSQGLYLKLQVEQNLSA